MGRVGLGDPLTEKAGTESFVFVHVRRAETYNVFTLLGIMMGFDTNGIRHYGQRWKNSKLRFVRSTPFSGFQYFRLQQRQCASFRFTDSILAQTHIKCM